MGGGGGVHTTVCESFTLLHCKEIRNTALENKHTEHQRRLDVHKPAVHRHTRCTSHRGASHQGLPQVVRLTQDALDVRGGLGLAAEGKVVDDPRGRLVQPQPVS